MDSHRPSLANGSHDHGSHDHGSHDHGSPDGQSHSASHMSATADELRQFVRQFRGKSPQEVMGLVSGNSLTQGTVWATILTVLSIAAFTAGPYYYNEAFQKPAKVAKAEPAPQPAAKTSQPATTESAAPVAVTAAPPATPKTALDPALADKALFMEKTGVGQSKSANPGVNPLENSANDLLKDLK